MATTTASLTITSSDLVGDALSLTTTNTLNKAGTLVGLEQTTGISTAYLTATTQIDLFNPIRTAAADAGKNNWVYICNKSTDETEYATIKIANANIGRLYAGDFMWMPWNRSARFIDISLTPSVATGMTVDYGLIFETTENLASSDTRTFTDE
tara:strand:- start:619 stop:1077 length:459 start_codon:yes stop_codon:yes gene_type:complete